MSNTRFIVIYIDEVGNAERRNDCHFDPNSLTEEKFNALLDGGEWVELTSQLRKELATLGVTEVVSGYGDTSFLFINPRIKR